MYKHIILDNFKTDKHIYGKSHRLDRCRHTTKEEAIFTTYSKKRKNHIDKYLSDIYNNI